MLVSEERSLVLLPFTPPSLFLFLVSSCITGGGDWRGRRDGARTNSDIRREADLQLKSIGLLLNPGRFICSDQVLHLSKTYINSWGQRREWISLEESRYVPITASVRAFCWNYRKARNQSERGPLRLCWCVIWIYGLIKIRPLWCVFISGRQKRFSFMQVLNRTGHAQVFCLLSGKGLESQALRCHGFQFSSVCTDTKDSCSFSAFSIAPIVSGRAEDKEKEPFFFKKKKRGFESSYKAHYICRSRLFIQQCF